MLPDYPESKARLRELLTQPLAMAQQAGIFSQMKTRRMFEGHRMGLIREDGSVDISDLQHLKSELQIDLKDIESITTADIFRMMLGQANEIHFKKSKAMLENTTCGGAKGARTGLGIGSELSHGRNCKKRHGTGMVVVCHDSSDSILCCISAF